MKAQSQKERAIPENISGEILSGTGAAHQSLDETTPVGGTTMFANRYSIMNRLASLMLVLGLGTSGPVAAQVAVSLPDVQGVSGAPMTVNVSVGDLTGRNVSGYQFEILYDPGVIEFTGLSTSGTLSGGLTTLSNSPSAGVFRVVGAGATPMSGFGTLIKLTGMFVAEGTSALSWNEFSFDNAGIFASLDGGSAAVTDRIAVVNVAIADVNGRPGSTVLIPVAVGNLSGLEVAGFSFNLTYNPAVVSISGVSTAGTMSAGRNVQATFPSAGIMNVQAVDASYLSGGGTLVNLVGTLEAAGTTTLDLTSFTFSRDGVDALTTDGMAMSVNAPPQFTSSPVTTARVGRRYEYVAVAVDADGDAITLGAPTIPTWASFRDNGDGTGLLYGQPGPGAVGVHNVILTASDPYGVTGLQKFSISVVPNGIPDAVDDLVATPRGVATEFDVLENDSDPDGDPLTLLSVSPAENGSTLVTSEGTVLYTPQPLYVGTDTFTYRISDGQDTDQATVTVSVENAAPVAVDDAARVYAGDEVMIDLLANDTDANGDVLSITELADPAAGTLLDNGDGTVTYSAAADFDGEDTFSYTVSDVYGASDQAGVIVTVQGPGTDGDFVDDAVEDGAPNGGDGNEDGVPDANQANVTSFAIVDGPNAGTYLTLEVVEGLSLAKVQSVPNPSPQDAPEASFPLAFLSFTVQGLQPGGSVEVTLHVPEAVELTGFVRYGPTPDQTLDHWYDFWYDGSSGARIEPGVVYLTYVDGTRGDDDLAADGVIVDPGAPVARANQTPVAVDDVASTNEDAAVVIYVLANDYDVDVDAVSLVNVSAAANGSIEDLGDGSLRYTPDADYFGTDAFTYTITDGMSMSEAATVTVQVTPVADPPVAIDDSATTNEDTPVEIGIFANDHDPDGTFHLASIGQPSHGTAAFMGNGIVKYSPDADFTGQDSFRYSIGDGTYVDDATVTIDVSGENDAPYFTGDDGLMSPDDGAQVVLVGDPDLPIMIEWPAATDPDGDPLQYRLQVASSLTFENRFMLYEQDMGSLTQFSWRQGDLAGVLTSLGVGLNESMTVYFRVEVTDGQERIMTRVTTCAIIRGAITDVAEPAELPVRVELEPNYPNPFNPETRIRFGLPDARHVRIAVYDMLGSEVAVLVDRPIPAGRHEVTFDARGLPSGTYLYRLVAGDRVLTRTFTLLK